MTTLNMPKGNIYLQNANNNVIEDVKDVVASIHLFNTDFEKCGLSYFESDGFALTMINGRFYYNTSEDGCFSHSSDERMGNRYLSIL